MIQTHTNYLQMPIFETSTFDDQSFKYLPKKSIIHKFPKGKCDISYAGPPDADPDDPNLNPDDWYLILKD